MPVGDFCVDEDGKPSWMQLWVQLQAIFEYVAVQLLVAVGRGVGYVDITRG